jgi:hypothetical protein
MIPRGAEVRLTPEDRAVLEARVRALTTEQRDVFRARIILLDAEGHSTRSITRTVDTMPRTVSLWRGRFSREGLSGLTDKPRPGSVEVQCRDRQTHSGGVGPSAASGVRATGGLIAAELGDMHEQQVWGASCAARRLTSRADSTRTGRKKFGRHETQHFLSSENPPPGTIMCT